jgi:hypothetical protein
MNKKENFTTIKSGFIIIYEKTKSEFWSHLVSFGKNLCRKNIVGQAPKVMFHFSIVINLARFVTR